MLPVAASIEAIRTRETIGTLKPASLARPRANSFEMTNPNPTRRAPASAVMSARAALVAPSNRKSSTIRTRSRSDR
jgi:hypothetical protein